MIISLLILSVFADLTYCNVPSMEFKPVDGYNPLLLQIAFRHGDRSPWLSYPGDPSNYYCDDAQQLRFISTQGIEVFEYSKVSTSINKKKNVFSVNSYGGTCNYGQLTRKGLNQLAELGDLVRKNYVGENNFLPEFFNKEDVYVRSTHVWRVLQSAESFLQHLYPSSYRNVEDRIHIHAVPSEIDYATSNSNRCPRISQLEQELFDKWFPTELNMRNEEPYKSLNEKASKMFGEITYNWYDAFFDILQEVECNGLDWPCVNVTNTDGSVEELCFTQTEFNTLTEQIYSDNLYRFYDNTSIPLSRLNAGCLNQTQYKYTHFHAHDTTIYPLLSLLEMDYSDWPPYASYIMFEMYEKDGVYYMKVGYNNKQADLDFCEKNEDGMCLWESFYNHLIQKIPNISDCQTK
ncbi:Prostatic acid phosphatase [Entamoeba marina]